MIKHNQNGAVNGLMLSLILVTVLLLGALGFGGWAYSQSQHYKNDVKAIVSEAEEKASLQTAAKKDKQFAEEVKNPLKTYSGPEAYGSLILNYPKTWSGYVDASGNGSGLVDGYFSPGVVPPTSSTSSVYALRVQVLRQPYAQVLQTLNSQQQTGKVSVSAYALPKLPQVVGVKVTGEIADKKTVIMVVVPLRSDTLKIWTEGTQFVDDFNNSILPNFSFAP